MLVGASAADHWALTGRRRPWAHVAHPRARRRRDAITFHRTQLAPDEVTEHDGIPATTVARTILDLAATTSRTRLAQAINLAEKRLLADAPSLPELLERHAGRRGSAAIRAILASGRLGLDIAKSELELEFLEFLERRGLPRPLINEKLVAGGRVLEPDCYWPEAGLIVEVDSRRHHADSTAFETDRGRDAALVAIGLRVVRVTHRALHDRPALLERQLRAALGASATLTAAGTAT